MIDPQSCVLYFPESRFGAKRLFLERLGRTVGHFTTDPEEIAETPADMVPIVGCYIELRGTIKRWRKTGRPFLYRDNGYFRDGAPSYRWHWSRYQMGEVLDRPSDRFDSLGLNVEPWRTGKDIVIAVPPRGYSQFHKTWDWAERAARDLHQHTSRKIKFRHKGAATSLRHDLRDAHALVTHASIAAIEAVLMGVPVITSSTCAAAHVGETDLSMIEDLRTPDRQPWLNALAYCQFTEREMLDGTIWKMLPPC